MFRTADGEWLAFCENLTESKSARVLDLYCQSGHPVFIVTNATNKVSKLRAINS